MGQTLPLFHGTNSILKLLKTEKLLTGETFGKGIKCIALDDFWR